MFSQEEIIFDAAKAFRKAFEATALPLRTLTFESFPAGACGDTSDLLGIYLSETLGISPMYFWGTDGEQSHAWLQHDGLIIDITADQFAGNQSIIVTRDSPFHLRFKIEGQRNAEITGFFAANLRHDYQLLKDFANNNFCSAAIEK
jgi:hypothetical protein